MTLYLLIAMAILMHLGFAGSRLVVPLFAVDQGGGPFVAGTIIALYAALPAVLAIPVGRAADRIGYQPLLVMGTGGIFAALITPSFFPSIAALYFVAALLGVSFIPLIFVCADLKETDKISFVWLAASTLVYTFGELYLSPIGLSLVTKVAPARLVSMMMGMWYLSMFFGNYLSGYFGAYYSSMSHAGFFTMLLVLGVVAGFAILAVKAPLKKAIGANV